LALIRGFMGLRLLQGDEPFPASGPVTET